MRNYVKIYIGDLSEKKSFSKSKTGKKISIVREYMNTLNDEMKESIRNKQYKVVGFDFERNIGNKLGALDNEIMEHLQEVNALEEIEKYDDYIYSNGEYELVGKDSKHHAIPHPKKHSLVVKNSNLTIILGNLDEIVELAKKTVNPAKIPDKSLLDEPGCVMPEFVQEKVLPLVKDEVKKRRGQSHKSTPSPVGWKQFVDRYLTSWVTVEKVGDSLDEPPNADKLRMSLSDRSEQKGYFEKITRNPSNETLSIFGEQYEREKTSFAKSSDLFFEKENLEAIRSRLGATMDYQIKHHKLWTDILNKVCPTTIMGKVMECTLPSLECRELLKEFGIKRIIPTISQFETFDPRLRTVRKKWEKLREQQNVKAIKFTGRSYMQAEPITGGIHENLQEFSISLWVRARSDDNKNGTHIFSHYRTRPEAERAFAVKVGSERNIKVTFHGNGHYADRKEIISSKRVFDSDWHHVLVTFNGPRGKIKIYINGEEDKNSKVRNYSNFTKVFNSSAPITFACSGNKTKNYTGFLDEVVIFKKELNSTNAKTLSNPKLVLRNDSSLTKNAMHWWRMGDDQRDIIDRSSNSFTRLNRIHDQLNDMHGTPKRFNRRSSGIYDAHPFDDGMLDELVAIIEEVFDLEVFCQLLLMAVFNAFGIDIPEFGGPMGIPKLPTNNPFGALLKLLEEAVVRLVVDTTMSIFMNLFEQLSVSCNDIGKVLEGDFAGTEMAKFADNFGDLLDKIATGDLGEISKNPLSQELIGVTADIMKQTEEFMNETGQFLEKAIKNGVVTKYRDPITGEERDYSAAVEDFDIVTPQEVEARKSGISESWMNESDNDEEYAAKPLKKRKGTPRQALREQIFCNPTKDLGSIMRDVSSLVPPDEILRLLAGEASINTLEVVAKVTNTKYPHLSFLSDNPEFFNQAFGILGVFTGLDKLRDKVLAAADDATQLGKNSSTFCFSSQEEDLFDKERFMRDVLNSKLSKEQIEDLLKKAQEDRKRRFNDLLDMSLGKDPTTDKDDEDEKKCEKNVYDSVPEPEIVEEMLARTIQSSISPLVMAYDADMLLYKPALSEQLPAARRVPKILWQGEDIQVTTFEDGKVASQKGKLKETIMNPEFKAMIASGHIPMKKDGKPDGTEFGAILKTKWWPPWDEDWMSKSERIPLGKGEDGESKGDASVDDLPGALGPYTDYDEDTGGSPFAFKDIQKVSVAANVRRHLKPENLEENYFSGRSEFSFKARNNDEKSIKLLREYNQIKKKFKRAKARLRVLQRQHNSKTTFFGFSFGGSDTMKALSSSVEQTASLSRSMKKKKNAYLKHTVSGSSNLDIYADKAFYGLDGVAENSVLKKVASSRGYTDPAPKLPTFNVTYANDFGTKYENNSLLSIRRFGKDPVQLNAVKKNSIDPLLESHLETKYNYDPSECDDATGKIIQTKYTSQENVFSKVISSKWKSAYGRDLDEGLIKSELLDSIDDGDDDDMMGSTYDDIMRKVMISLATEVRNTPLLSKIEGTENEDTGDSAIGIQFADFNPTQSEIHKKHGLDPRIMDFKSFTKQVQDDYKFFKDCKLGEVNRDGKRKYKTPLSMALRAAHPNMVARLYSLEYLLQAIFPVIEFNSELDPTTEKMLMDKIRNDMRKRPGYFKEFSDNTLEMQNLKAEYGLLKEDTSETIDESFMPILRKEYAFVLEKLRQVVLKECPPDTSEDEGETGTDPNPASNSNTEGVPGNFALELKKILIDNISMLDVVDNRFSKIRVGLNRNQRNSLRRTKRAIRRTKRLVGMTNKIVRDHGVEIMEKYDLVDIFDSDKDRRDALKDRRKRFKEKQKRRRELLKNRAVRQKARYKDKNRLEILGRGQIYLERYIRNTSGNIVKTIGQKDVNLNSSKHLLNSKVEKYGIRLVYVELADHKRERTTPDGEEVSIEELITLAASNKDDAYVVNDNEFLAGFNYPKDGGTKHKRYWRKEKEDYDKEYTIRNAKPRPNKTKTFFVHPLAEYEVDADDLLGLLGISRDDSDKVECFALEGFTGPGIAERKNVGVPDHYHEYEVDANGNGHTTAVLVGDDNKYDVVDHEHEIVDFKVQNEVYVFPRSVVRENHVHELVQDSDIEEGQDTITGKVSRKIFDHLSRELIDTEDFRVMFEYCFNLQDVSSVISSYSFLANSTREMQKMFDVTKRRLENYLFNASEGSNYFNSATGCNEAQMAKSMFNMGNSNMDDLWNPSLLLLLLMTPLHIYKGWSKMADPHVLITQTIVELGQAGFLIPKMVEQKIEIPFTDPVDCETLMLPTFPGEKIGFPGFTQLVALGVTFAPCLVMLPPFPPTPFGLIYYLLVDPLLMLMSPWANELMKNDPNLQRGLENAGLNLQDPIPLCIPEEEEEEEESGGRTPRKQKPDEDDSCAPSGPDPVSVGGYGKSNC